MFGRERERGASPPERKLVPTGHYKRPSRMSTRLTKLLEEEEDDEVYRGVPPRRRCFGLGC